jgi:hypothetical protein
MRGQFFRQSPLFGMVDAITVTRCASSASKAAFLYRARDDNIHTRQNKQKEKGKQKRQRGEKTNHNIKNTSKY